MRKLLSLFVIFPLLLSCSEKSSKLNCEGWGLVISKSKAIYGPTEYSYCSKEGNWSFYYLKNTMCNAKDVKDFLSFDEVSNQLTIVSEKSMSFKECKKID